ncbi:tyrosine-type recombinase/integrase [Nocardiopsis eucommiae]|uniref:tyrosine-type recombinase/integrase n=1 Tax=Nocardiopsis eucommiae TaxID=2831970 RepID=UPI003D73286C
MAYAEKLVKSWRACWKNAAGKIEKRSGYPTKKKALDYAKEQEVEASRRGSAREDASQMLVRDWVEEWYAGLDLELNTMLGYQSILTNHILPRWGETRLRELATSDAQIKAWAKSLHDAGYTYRTATGIVSLLGTLCADAIDAGLIHRNPAVARRNRGKYTSRREATTRPTTIVNPFTALLLAERAGVLTGRDDEFILITSMFYTGMRISEAMAVELGSVSGKYPLQKQLSRGRKTKVFYSKGPKFNSKRVLDIPDFLLELWRLQAQQVVHHEVPEGAQWCPCGTEVPEENRHAPGVHLFAGDVWHHWDQTAFRHRLLYPAAWGRFYPGMTGERPVYQALREDGGDPGPFEWDSSRIGEERSEAAVACWAPIASDLTPHGLRHSHKTLMEELGTPKPLMDERMGHRDHTVSGRYSHPTEVMRGHLQEALTGVWEDALEQRRRMGVESRVPVLRALLGQDLEPHSRSTPDGRPRLLEASRGRVA